jgi:hypothetical protein
MKAILSNQPRILFATTEAAFAAKWTRSCPEIINPLTDGYSDLQVKMLS